MDSTIVNASEKDAVKAVDKTLPKSLKFKIYLVALPIIAFSVLVALGALPRIFQAQALINHTHIQTSQNPSVSIVLAQASPSVDEFSLPGSTQAVQYASIYARVDGYLRQRYVDIGDKVRTGQVLAYIDTPELDKQVKAAESNVEQALANLDNAKQALRKAGADQRAAAANKRKAKTDLQYYTVEVGRYKLLSEQGAVSMEDSDTRTQAYNAGLANLDAMIEAEQSAQASVQSAMAAVHVAQATLDAARAQRDQIEATRSFKKVTALFDGIVTACNIDAGALITSGSTSANKPIFEIAHTDILRVYVYVPEQFVPNIHLGQQALLNVQEYPGKDFVGTVSHVAGGIDPTSKTLQVEVRIPNADHKLLPGMYAQARFRSPAPVRLAMVPATTAQTRADGCFMYTVDDRDLVHVHKVEIGRDLGGQFEVARGINPGDKVIVSPSDDMKEGLAVKPVMAPVQAKPDGK